MRHLPACFSLKIYEHHIGSSSLLRWMVLRAFPRENVYVVCLHKDSTPDATLTDETEGRIIVIICTMLADSSNPKPLKFIAGRLGSPRFVSPPAYRKKILNGSDKSNLSTISDGDWYILGQKKNHKNYEGKVFFIQTPLQVEVYLKKPFFANNSGTIASLRANKFYLKKQSAFLSFTNRIELHEKFRRMKSKEGKSMRWNRLDQIRCI